MTLALYTAAIFLGAALLFVVQPLVARMILPVLGGSPAVWNTAMAFFQAALLCGYVYAHVLTKRFGVKAQVLIHTVVLLLPAIVLPIALPSWAPPATRFPAGWMLLVLLVAVGLPFFVVATTGPLMQRWFSRAGHHTSHDPYYLYAASNTGSLLALLGYPVIIEPVIGLASQSIAWTVGYVVFVVLALACGVVMLRGSSAPVIESADGTARAAVSSQPLSWRRRLLWVFLAFVPSSLMLGVTQHVSTDIAAAPLLWVIPLSIYLLTFILAFSPRVAITRASLGKMYPLIACAVCVAFLIHARQPGMLLIAMHVLLLFIGALLCHTRLAEDRPGTTHLTEFYLLIAVGGVLGGAFNALLAPLIFTQLYEYPIAIVLVAFAMSRSDSRNKRWGERTHRAIDFIGPLSVLAFVFGARYVVESGGISGLIPELIRYGLPVLACYLASTRPLRFGLTLGAVLLFAAMDTGADMRVVWRDRTFFGYYRVVERASEHGTTYQLLHGTTSHGVQVSTPPLVFEPSSYYTREGPVGQAMAFILGDEGAQRGALVGLGVGAMAAYARDGDTFAYYEIDPAIVDIANDERYFSYVRAAENRGATIEYVLGDARLTLGDAPPGAFDFIAVDAFSSDAIPIHLMTTEAFELYFDKLADDGVLLLHISNHFLNLEPVVDAIVHELGLLAVVREDVRNMSNHPLAHYPSTWVVVVRRGTDLRPLIASGAAPDEPNAGYWRALQQGDDPWTDDHADLVRALVWDLGGG